MSGRRLHAACAGAATWLLLALTTPALADDGDPPERVAVVDVVEGAAAAQPAGVGEWIADLVNRPLTSGDRLWVDADSRAELHLGSAAIRIGANTGLQFLAIGDRVAQLRLSCGSMNVRLRYLSPDETFEIDTPNTAVTLSQSGEYRVDVSDSGEVVSVAVWRGEAEIAGETQSFTLEPQQQGEFRGHGALGVEFRDLPPADGLDQWAQYRDQREDRLLTANFVSRDLAGYADLEGYGSWQSEPELGAVWQPQVTPDWAPYSQGYWVWIAPWGWTWVDAAPWGFAPFHYGRWVHRSSGWAWCPGQPSVRPVYAPALVVWASGAGGEVMWFPLGYNEIYRPARHVSDQYLRRVNVTNTYLYNTATIDRSGDATARYANQAIPGALTAMDRERFTSAQPVDRSARPSGATLATVTAVNRIAPRTSSFAPAAVPGHRVAAVPPRAIFARPVMARTAPPRDGTATVDQRQITVTTVPRAEARPRPPATLMHGMPQGAPDMRHPAPAVPEPPPGLAIARPQPPPALPLVPRPDRPAVMPQPERKMRVERLPAEPPHVEAAHVEAAHVERPRVEPPRVDRPPPERPPPEPRRESRPAEPARKTPDKAPARIDR